MGKGRFCWEGQNNYTVIMSHLSCNHISKVAHDTAICYNMGFIGLINIVETNRIYDDTDACDQMCWESESEHLPDIMPTEENWPEEDLGLINDKLITVLNHSTNVYH